MRPGPGARGSARWSASGGADDHVVDASRPLGHAVQRPPWMTRVTGVGCSASALVGAFAAVQPTPGARRWRRWPWAWSARRRSAARPGRGRRRPAADRAARRPAAARAGTIDRLRLRVHDERFAAAKAGCAACAPGADSNALCGERGVLSVVGCGARRRQLRCSCARRSLGTRPSSSARVRSKANPGAAGVPLIINDRVDVALACGADGIHVGHDGASRRAPAAARRAARPVDRDAGAAGSRRAQAGRLLRHQPGLSTATKKDAAAAVGLEGLRLMRSAPGVRWSRSAASRRRMRSVVAAGADRLAVVSALRGARPPRSRAGSSASCRPACAGAEENPGANPRQAQLAPPQPAPPRWRSSSSRPRRA